MTHSQDMSSKVHSGLLNRKLRVASSNDIHQVCSAFGYSFENVRTVLVRRGVLVPVLFKGVFYIRTPNELLTESLPDGLKLVSLACTKRFGQEWYFGLHTALKLSNIAGVRTQNKIFVVIRQQIIPSVRMMSGVEVVFSQLKNVPFNEGIEENTFARFSGPVRTALDFLHLGIKAGDSTFATMLQQEVMRMVGRKIFDTESKKLLGYYSTSKTMEHIIGRNSP